MLALALLLVCFWSSYLLSSCRVLLVVCWWLACVPLGSTILRSSWAPSWGMRACAPLPRFSVRACPFRFRKVLTSCLRCDEEERLVYALGAPKVGTNIPAIYFRRSTRGCVCFRCFFGVGFGCPFGGFWFHIGSLVAPCLELWGRCFHCFLGLRKHVLPESFFLGFPGLAPLRKSWFYQRNTMVP